MDDDVSVSDMTDETIKRLIVDELFWDSRVDASKVTVEVTNGIVSLGGHVPTVADRYSAEADARLVTNVITVENHIDVHHPEIIPDRELQEIVTRTLDWTPDVDSTGLEVFVKAGTVSLRGSVPTYWQKLRSHLEAAKIRGVICVKDEVAVTPLATVEDRQIANTLERYLARKLRDDVNSVQVIVENGRVVLRGQVTDLHVKQDIQSFIERTSGVSEFRNELTHPAHRSLSVGGDRIQTSQTRIAP